MMQQKYVECNSKIKSKNFKCQIVLRWDERIPYTKHSFPFYFFFVYFKFVTVIKYNKAH